MEVKMTRKARKSEILWRLLVIAVADDGSGLAMSMGKGPHPWIWIKNGEFCGGNRLEMSDKEASLELNKLVKAGKVKICVNNDELQLQLP